jgi:ABC-type nitrate/sulfonate/bicarbonate transport system substrate-binding protein
MLLATELVPRGRPGGPAHHDAGAGGNLALIAGNVDFTSVPTAAITAALRGAPLRALFTSFDKPLFWLYAKPEVAISRASKKKIGTSGLGAAETCCVNS